MKVDIYNKSGNKTSKKIDLNEKVFKINPNEHSIYLSERCCIYPNILFICMKYYVCIVTYDLSDNLFLFYMFKAKASDFFDIPSDIKLNYLLAVENTNKL